MKFSTMYDFDVIALQQHHFGSVAFDTGSEIHVAAHPARERDLNVVQEVNESIRTFGMTEMNSFQSGA